MRSVSLYAVNLCQFMSKPIWNVIKVHMSGALQQQDVHGSWDNGCLPIMPYVIIHLHDVSE